MSNNELGSKEMIEKAQRARRENAAKAERMKQDWADDSVWRALAKEYGVKLAQKHVHCGEQVQKYVTRRLKVDSSDVKRAFGLTKLEEFGTLNPRTPMYVFQGLVLEALRDGDLVQEVR